MMNAAGARPPDDWATCCARARSLARYGPVPLSARPPMGAIASSLSPAIPAGYACAHTEPSVCGRARKLVGETAGVGAPSGKRFAIRDPRSAIPVRPPRRSRPEERAGERSASARGPYSSSSLPSVRRRRRRRGAVVEPGVAPGLRARPLGAPAIKVHPFRTGPRKRAQLRAIVPKTRERVARARAREIREEARGQQQLRQPQDDDDDERKLSAPRASHQVDQADDRAPRPQQARLTQASKQQRRRQPPVLQPLVRGAAARASSCSAANQERRPLSQGPRRPGAIS